MQLKDKLNIHIHDQVEPHSTLITNGDYRIGYFVMRNKDKTTEENEDCLFICGDEDHFIFGVADGAGGHPRGRDASFEISKFLSETKDVYPLDMIEKANQKVVDLKVGARSTLAMAHVNNSSIQFFSVGDSEAIYWNAAGSEIFSTTPHSPVGSKIAAGLTTQEDSLQDPERFLVSNMMGEEFVKIECTTSLQLKKGHTILIGSDGVFDNISHEKLAEIVAQGVFEDCFEDIVKLCTEQDENEWLKKDDISFVLLRKIKA